MKKEKRKKEKRKKRWKWGRWESGDVGGENGGERGKIKKKKILVLHIAAFFENRSYRSPLKNCSAGPIAAFFKNAATDNL